MFDSLSNSFQDLINRIGGQDKINDSNIDGAITELRRQLIESDVSLKAVKLFIQKVRNEALGQKVYSGLKASEQFTKILYDALVERLGGSLDNKINLNNKVSSILLLGLQGAGKTTTAAKLAYKFRSEGRKPLLVPCDLQRPAAVLQLKTLANNAEIDFLDITQGDSYTVSSPLDLVSLAQKYAENNANDVLIFDTAGRLQVDTDLMAELLLLEKSIKPNEKLLVIDSLIGQEAANVADTFHTQIGITGVILTKLDSDTRGGAALSVVEASNQPIKLVTVGEKFEDIEAFYPDRMASRILGRGDLDSLLEKVNAKINEQETLKLEEAVKSGKFNFENFIQMQEMFNKLGNLSSIMNMMGMGALFAKTGLSSRDQSAMVKEREKEFQKSKILIQSMTIEERQNPDLIISHHTSRSRKARLAKGSGFQSSEIDSLVKQFNILSKTFKTIGPMLGLINPQEEVMDPRKVMQKLAPSMNKKQQQAMNQMGLLGANKANKTKTIAKGQKPIVKGFKD